MSSRRPLADLMRPKSMDEFVGQEHLVGKNGLIRKLIDKGKKTGFFPSIIFWGPPGCGKTTLARIIASELGRKFYEFSAVNTSVKEIEKVIGLEPGSGEKICEAKKQKWQLSLVIRKPESNKKDVSAAPVVFIDEIHRFNKAQQDAFLPFVEKGIIVFLGATTENPSFEIIGPLLSRCRVVVMNRLSEKELLIVIKRALDKLSAKITKDAAKFLVEASNGDARVALNVIEIASNLSKTKRLSLTDVEEALQRRQLFFDLKGEEFYNTISALHKSIRGSDPDAALYWLARMLEAGQDPLYIARRLIRAAAEDIGLADPQALIIANAAFEACDKIGMPECSVVLAEAVSYLAKAPKSNAVYLAYGKAGEDVHKYGNLPVPLSIRNPVTKLMRELGYGKGYKFYHSPKGKKLKGEVYLPEKLKDKKYLK